MLCIRQYVKQQQYMFKKGGRVHIQAKKANFLYVEIIFLHSINKEF